MVDNSGDSQRLRVGVERSTRLGLGLVSGLAGSLGQVLRPDTGEAAGEPPSPGSTDPSWGDVVVGAVLTTQEGLLDVTERAGALVARLAPAGRRAADLPGVRPLVDALDLRSRDLAARGRTERRRAGEDLGSAVDTVVGQVSTSDMVGRTVEDVVAEVLPGVLDAALPAVLERLAAEPGALREVIDGLLEPILEEALPLVLDRLNDDPAVVQQLVLGQSTSIAGELAGVVRSRAVLGDDLAERVARRLTFRRPRPQLPAGGEPPQLAAGDPG